MVFDEFLQLRGPLVVGGVCFEDQVILLVEDASYPERRDRDGRYAGGLPLGCCHGPRD